MAWIFQGNPKLFAIDDYLSQYGTYIYWSVPQHKDSIKINDRAFIWRSGPHAGLVASGKIAEAPKLISELSHPEALGERYWQESSSEKGSFKAGIALDTVRLSVQDGMVSREAVQDDRILRGHPIIQAPQSTVFRLDNPELSTLETLWDNRSPDEGLGYDFSVVEGTEKMVFHRKRERNRGIIRRKLEEMRSAKGSLACSVCGLKEEATYPSEFAAKVFEVHHLKPIASATAPSPTTLGDLLVVCANCHRAIHATEEVEENLKSLREAFAADRGLS